jgi:hypothetical protein
MVTVAGLAGAVAGPGAVADTGVAADAAMASPAAPRATVSVQEVIAAARGRLRLRRIGVSRISMVSRLLVTDDAWIVTDSSIHMRFGVPVWHKQTTVAMARLSNFC